MTSATTVVGFPPADMSTIAKITTAKARFVAGPAAMATIRFQMGCRQYASWDRLSPMWRTPRRVPFEESSPAAVEKASSSTLACSKSSAASERFSRSAGPTSSGASRIAPPKNASTSDAWGRVMPGIVT